MRRASAFGVGFARNFIHLVQHQDLRSLRGSDLAQRFDQCAVCSAAPGKLASTTCTAARFHHLFQRGAKTPHQHGWQVADEPDVSLNSTRRCEGSVAWRTVGSSVANILASASTFAPVRR